MPADMRTIFRWENNQWVRLGSMAELRVGDIFRMYEPDGTLVGTGKALAAPETTALGGRIQADLLQEDPSASENSSTR